MNDDSIYIETLRKYFGYDSFRSIQLDIIRSIAQGHDTLGLMPTGGGKSITFQVPALAMEGVCLVITPLISLMKDQVANLKARGIQAEMVYSGISKQEIQRILDNAIYGGVKFLYISPERIATAIFQQKVKYMKVCFITVDEAHCISQWGYDFRPSYLKINDIRQIVPPQTPILALTATATPHVVEDIQRQLHFGETTPGREPHFFKMSFLRKNLYYVVRETTNPEYEILHILNALPGSAIIFTMNRDTTKDVASFLNDHHISAAYYHAGLDTAIKNQRQELWQQDKIRVMVATNAFGMGIDKPNVRLVIHYDVPSSLEAYFQEAGRAGRDGLPSYAVLLTNRRVPQKLLRRIDHSFPPKGYIRNVYDNLAYYFQLPVESGQGARFEFDKEKFCYKFEHFPVELDGALAILQHAGYIKVDIDQSHLSRVKILISREEVYDLNYLSPTEQAVFNFVIRTLPGVFTDYAYFLETPAAELLGIDQLHLYVALKSLAQRGIWKYVPASSTPTIYYPMQRIPSNRLKFPKEVYEDLRQRLQEHLEACISYVTNDKTCRSRQLLSYFGETDSPDCGHCDVCVLRKQGGPKNVEAEITQKIKQLLSDGKPHQFNEIKQWDERHKYQQIVHDIINKAVRDGKVIIDPPFIKAR